MSPKDIGIYIKFVERQFVKSTLAGNLFFSSSKYFREHESRYKSKEVGDVYDPYESSDRYGMNIDAMYEVVADKAVKLPLSKNRIHINFNTVNS